MKVIIEIEKDEELKKIRKAFEGATIKVVRTKQDKNKILEAIFKKYNVKLPKNYTFDKKRYMPDRVFVDTNILVYFISDEKKRKNCKPAILSSPAKMFMSALR